MEVAIDLKLEGKPLIVSGGPLSLNKNEMIQLGRAVGSDEMKSNILS